MADASDGPHSSLSLGLAHDVFALPLHCQRLNSAATPLAFFDKSGPSVRATDIHLTATLIHSQVPRPATDINYFNLCAALSGSHNEGIEMQGMFTAAFMQVLHLLQFTGKDDA